MRRVFIAAASLAATSAAFAQAGDVKGSKDHPLLPRYENSDIIRYETKAFDEYRLMVAPAKRPGGKDKNEEATLRLEGKYTQIAYRAPALLEVTEVKPMERRMKAVEASTVERDIVATGRVVVHGIARDRMPPVGAGMAAPMATNRTEEGRALNRRVELVDLGN
ncbi:MAG TPA: hypothetical protein VNQ99_12530 [Xanthobacteraceae bacterium]|nr:hypothetical protein [Xanthobacteraceae bacterium]